MDISPVYRPPEKIIVDQHIFHISDMQRNQSSIADVPFHQPKFFRSGVSDKIINNFTENIKKTSFRSWFGKEINFDFIGEDLDITLEVYRLSEYHFKFPSHYLDGLKPNPIARVDGNMLNIYTQEIGEEKLHTNYAVITVRTLPGLRTRKVNLGHIS